MSTVVAALIAAAAALVVVILDRVVAATNERKHRSRETRRRVYADYLGGLHALIVWSTEERTPSKANLPAALELGRRMTVAFAELEMLAPVPVVKAAQKLNESLGKWDSKSASTPPGYEDNRRAFVLFARQDVSSGMFE